MHVKICLMYVHGLIKYDNKTLEHKSMHLKICIMYVCGLIKYDNKTRKHKSMHVKICIMFVYGLIKYNNKTLDKPLCRWQRSAQPEPGQPRYRHIQICKTQVGPHDMSNYALCSNHISLSICLIHTHTHTSQTLLAPKCQRREAWKLYEDYLLKHKLRTQTALRTKQNHILSTG